mmetsp:Transcript_6684/g.27966  ORF Transcript_6684/g.27966 Transcript_6684/m.27966 type:complete len:537 (-) Transcript_6684:250-1860(-)
MSVSRCKVDASSGPGLPGRVSSSAHRWPSALGQQRQQRGTGDLDAGLDAGLGHRRKVGRVVVGQRLATGLGRRGDGLRRGDADAHRQRRHALGGVDGKVLAGRLRFGDVDLIGAERAFKRRIDPLDHTLVVDDRAHALDDVDLRRRCARQAGHRGGGAAHAVAQQHPHLRRVGAQRAAQHGLVRDDVGHRAGLEGADGDDAELARVLLAADHRLHLGDEACRDHDGVDGVVGRRTVAAAPLEGDLEGVGRRHRRARPVLHASVRGLARGVDGQGHFGLGETGEQAVRDHRVGALQDLFRRLGDEHQPAAPAVLQRDHGARRAHPGGHVHIVAAAVGDEALAAVGHGLGAARIGQAGLFFHGQRVEFGTNHNGGAGAVLEDRDQPGLADALGHREAQRAHLGRELGGRAHLLEGDLGVAVDVLVERLQRRIGPVDLGVDGAVERGRLRAGVGGQHGQHAQPWAGEAAVQHLNLPGVNATCGRLGRQSAPSPCSRPPIIPSRPTRRKRCCPRFLATAPSAARRPRSSSSWPPGAMPWC